ncbi:MAG: GAF domain-containing sensor histidine kinase [bacterium]|nr:GAF domain-containing sensor histidine kinase [bacterium]
MFKFFHTNPKSVERSNLGLVHGRKSIVAPLEADPKEVQENLYRQNLELAVKNKTLSLLAKLYEISTQTLEPKELARQVVFSVRTILNVRFVGIYLFSKEKDEFTPLGISTTDIIEKIKTETACDFGAMHINHVSQSKFWKPLFANYKSNQTESLFEFFGNQVSPEVAARFRSEAHMKTALCYPLVIDNEVIGLFLVVINRTYEMFSEHERNSVEAAVNVLALILDKAQLYQELKVANQKLGDANERLKELDQLKSEFVSLATHQIRGPLTAIKGYASMMIEGDYGEVPTSLKDPIDTVYRSSQSLVVIVEDFLNVSRIEQGKMKYDFSDFDFCVLVNEVVNESRPIIEKRGLNVGTTICPAPVTVRGDRGKLKQVIGNLFDNSMKYTPKGSINLTLESNKISKKVLLSIKDTGVGINAETIPHLFKKFSRAEDASKVNILGTGLGLYVASEMIKAHGGRVWVESEGVGKGATFFVELSLV